MSVFDSEKSCKACVHQGNLMTSDGILYFGHQQALQLKTKQNKRAPIPSSHVLSLLLVALLPFKSEVIDRLCKVYISSKIVSNICLLI